MTVEGICPDRYEPLRTAFEAAFDAGLESGASVAVAEEGEVVVDLWGGVADAATGRPWERDTICCLWSTTKTMTALCVLALADRGEIDLDSPVARYWPEFAAAGKEGVLVRHVMAHTAGVSGWDRPTTGDDLLDRRAASAALAEQAPWWDDRSVSGYHAITQGFLLGELVERVTGASPGTWFREEVAGPLGGSMVATRGSTSSGVPMWKSAPTGPATSSRNQVPSDAPVTRSTSSPSRNPWVMAW